MTAQSGERSGPYMMKTWNALKMVVSRNNSAKIISTVVTIGIRGKEKQESVPMMTMGIGRRRSLEKSQWSSEIPPWSTPHFLLGTILDNHFSLLDPPPTFNPTIRRCHSQRSLPSLQKLYSRHYHHLQL